MLLVQQHRALEGEHLSKAAIARFPKERERERERESTTRRKAFKKKTADMARPTTFILCLLVLLLAALRPVFSQTRGDKGHYSIIMVAENK